VIPAAELLSRWNLCADREHTARELARRLSLAGANHDVREACHRYLAELGAASDAAMTEWRLAAAVERMRNDERKVANG
jgi:hypothetical protein